MIRKVILDVGFWMLDSCIGDCVRILTAQENLTARENSRNSRSFFSIRVKSLSFPDFFNANDTRIPANAKNLIGSAELSHSLIGRFW